jgi:hypothetical protein
VLGVTMKNVIKAADIKTNKKLCQCIGVWALCVGWPVLYCGIAFLLDHLTILLRV